MRYLSVCSGIEAATVAWHSLGWKPVAFAEIEAFPSAVLAQHYPNVPNLGDFTKIEAADVGPIDLLVGGTPCQDFSVAGKRLGLDGARGNLALEFCRLARRLRPRWIVWENVPGVHSNWSGAPKGDDLDGEWRGDEDSDFGAFLDALEECGYSSCWRVLDTQYVRVDTHPRAVPQRRERVFVVGYLGDWRPPAAVLLEPEGLRRDTPPRQASGKATAHDIAPSLTSSGRGVERGGDTRGQDPVIAVDVAQITSKENRCQPEAGGPCHPLPAHGHAPALAWSVCLGSDPIFSKELAMPSTARNGDPGVVNQGWAVRRLSPTECERLQAFPDGYTAIPYRGKKAADGPRYKALGNSMSTNVMRWIGLRINLFEEMIGRAILEAAE